MKVLAWIENGAVRFIELQPEWTKDDIRKRFSAAIQGEGAGITFCRVVEREDLPADARFRLAWELSNGRVVLSLTKAKKHTRDRILQLWQIVGPKLMAKKRYAEATGDAADLAEADAEIAQWQALRQSGAIGAATNTEELWKVYQTAFDLAEPYLEENRG